jgi:hypothetical protein
MELESRNRLGALFCGEVKNPVRESSLGMKLESRNRLGALVCGEVKNPVWCLGKRIIY